MTIACRTGCGEQIENDHHPFPDGFIYFLPKNNDGTIHNCKNLTQFQNSWSKEEEEKTKEFEMALFGTGTERPKIKWPTLKDSSNNEFMENVKSANAKFFELFSKAAAGALKNFNVGKNALKSEYAGMGFPGPDKTMENKMDDFRTTSYYQKLLINFQMRCILFPTPFLSNPIGMGTSDVMVLSTIYSSLSNYDCSLKALLIQNHISHDKDDTIMEYYKKINLKKESKETDDVKKTAAYIKNNYFLKVEKLTTSFIRENYSLESLKLYYPKYVISAEKLMRDDSKELSRENEDVFEFLTFGQIAKILRKNKQKNISPFTDVSWRVMTNLSYIVDIRNIWAHPKDDLEKSVKESTKYISTKFSIDVIDFFENLKLK